MYFLWDVLPLTAIMVYHLKAFRAEEKERNMPSIDWARQSTGSNSTAAAADTEAPPTTPIIVDKEQISTGDKGLMIKDNSLEYESTPDQENPLSQSLIENAVATDLNELQTNEMQSF